MSTSQVTSFYYSGQGSVLLAERDVSGNALGFTPVGNVTALTLGIEVSKLEHKESVSGSRGIDKTLIQEVNVSMSMVMESLFKENLAVALYGSSSSVAAGSISDEQVVARHDKWVALSEPNLSAVVIGDDAVPTNTYIEGTDYLLNAAAGSFMALSTGGIADAQTVFVDATTGGHDVVEGFISSAAPERWLRFEGLTTAEGDKTVVVDVYKFAIDPLAELALINEELAEMTVEGSVLQDTTKPTGGTSQYFRQQYVVV